MQKDRFPFPHDLKVTRFLFFLIRMTLKCLKSHAKREKLLIA